MSSSTNPIGRRSSRSKSGATAISKAVKSSLGGRSVRAFTSAIRNVVCATPSHRTPNDQASASGSSHVAKVSPSGNCDSPKHGESEHSICIDKATFTQDSLVATSISIQSSNQRSMLGLGGPELAVSPKTNSMRLQSSSADQSAKGKQIARTSSIAPKADRSVAQLCNDLPKFPKGKRSQGPVSVTPKAENLTEQPSSITKSRIYEEDKSLTPKSIDDSPVQPYSTDQSRILKGKQIVGFTNAPPTASSSIQRPLGTDQFGGKRVAATRTHTTELRNERGLPTSNNRSQLKSGAKTTNDSDVNFKKLTPSCSKHQGKQNEKPLTVHYIKSQVSGLFNAEDREIQVFQIRCELCRTDLAFPPAGSTSNEKKVPIHAVLPCGHCFHDDCLETVFGPLQASQIPPCIACSEPARS